LARRLLTAQQGRSDRCVYISPVGNTGHDIGPSLTWQPPQTTFVMHAQHMFSFEYFAYTPISEWAARSFACD
jgi:hypothetical protein